MSKKCLGDIFLTFFDILPKPSWTPGHFFDIFGDILPATPRDHPQDIFCTFFGESRIPHLTARMRNMAAGLLSLLLDLAAKNTFQIAGKDFRIAGKEDITLILAIIMAMSWP